MSSISNQSIQIFLQQNKDKCTFQENEIRSTLDLLEKERNYYPKRFLGAGYNGIVIYATKLDGSEYAIKIIISNKEDPIREAEKESKLVLNVSSPYVVKYFEHFSSLKLKAFFLVTEYCQRGNIKDLDLSTNKMTKDQIVKYSVQFLKGLKDLHHKSIFHGNLKPDNILISNNGKLKICDFGLQRHVEARSAYASKQGNILYMPPEGIVAQEREKDQTSITSSYDVFSAGGIILFLCDPTFELQLTLIKQGKFPNIKGHKLEKCLQIALCMMNTDPKERLALNQAIHHVKALNHGHQSDEEDSQDEEEEDVRKYLKRKLNETFKYLHEKLDEKIPDV